ncbi:MAG: DUF5777 family beta-barrel protein [Vicinamibacterales bacterium]
MTTRYALLIAALLVALGGANTHAQPRPEGVPRKADDEDLSIDHAVVDFTLVNLPTTLRLPRYKSAFRVTHRFTRPLGEGSFGDLAADFFGFDSHAQIGLEFRFAPARGGELRFYRTSDRTIQLGGQYNFARQGGEWPVSLTGLFSIEGLNNFKEQYSPAVGAVVSREFGERGAVFVQGVWVGNTNGLPSELAGDQHTFLAGVGARLRILPTVYLVGETAVRAAGHSPGTTPVSLGIEKTAGGHVFQVNFSNSVGSTFAQVARGGLADPNWHLGFNISRKFY